MQRYNRYKVYKLVIINNITDTIKRLMFYFKCRSIEVINNPAKSGSNHMEVNYNNNNNNELKFFLRCEINVRIKQ